VQEIHQASERLHSVVVNLLDTTRLESGGLQAQLDWCDVSDLVNAALKIAGDAQHGRTIHLQLPLGLPLVWCDFDLIQQALANLVHNACRHTPARAEITVSAGVDEAAGRVWLAVADNGPGLREEQRARLFERFFRGEPGRAGGLGLGLSIARGFAETQGGSLTAENQPGGGARFVLALPLQHHDQVPAE
jgi:two-component system sensor histidine kinase KdpD